MIQRIFRAAVLLAVVVGVAPLAHASDAMFLRLFLVDGTPLVSYGEFARLNEHVVFSMPIGGTSEAPRLHLVSIPSTSIDWNRTDRYLASARYQHYAVTSGEQDYARFTDDVARVLNEVAHATEPAKALKIVTTARTRLAEWPVLHYGYRQREVTEIVEVLDASIANLRAAAGVGAFDVALAANVPTVALEPMFGMPDVSESLKGTLAAARMTDRSPDRLLLLQSALALLDNIGAAIPAKTIRSMRTSITRQILEEQTIDQRYTRLSRTMLASASKAASAARVRDLEALLERISAEDRRLGNRRPDVVLALRTSLEGHLGSARHLRLLRDQWELRKDIYRGYQQAMRSRLLRLVKAQPALEAIRRLDGPMVGTLQSLNGRLAGGADQLQRMPPPSDLRGVHDMIIGAWRFAEQAVSIRGAAIAAGNVNTAWEASSAAAASLMLLSNAQQQLRSYVEPPQLR
jgi:hypothetical protein